MSCLIGIVDSRIHSERELGWDTNKIGGNLTLPTGIKTLPQPSCKLCGRSLLLVVQLYCPLDYSCYHRVLYVFACGNHQCWNKSESWAVYRCQIEDKSSARNKDLQAAKTDVGLKPCSDDWGVGDKDDWGADEADNWGTGANDWGGGMENEQAGTGSDKSGIEGAESWDIRKDNGVGGEGNLQETCCSKEDPDTRLASEIFDTADTTDDIPLEQINIHDSGDDSGNERDAQVIPEDSQAVGIDKNMLKRLCEVTGLSESNHTIIPYYLNVFEEPGSQEENSYYVTKLLKEYEKKEGYRMNNSEPLAESGKKGQAEGYERVTVHHKDITFHKFMKRIALCPQQCIRYEWNGTPQLIKNLSAKVGATKCLHCGGETVYEFQLMPALVNYLKTEENAGAVVEFGTVLVFTCKKSCWEDDAMFKTEQVIVQADPDQELFT